MDDSVTVVRLAEIRDSELSVDEVTRAVADPRAGGTTVFVGTVRSEDHRRHVAALGYSAHPSATAQLRSVIDTVIQDHPVVAIAAVHRTGELRVGDIAVVVAVACAHRDAAFAATRQLIENLKHDVPIWKRQVFADGDQEWVGAD
jgi:molybdopterin synthase catalytic subunit